MQILAKIPTGKRHGQGWYQETTDLMEVNVISVMRYRCDRNRERYYYEAKIKAPACILSDAVGMENGTYRVNVNRKLNPKWKPPVFPDGVNRVEV
jgi:hypothetical protein